MIDIQFTQQAWEQVNRLTEFTPIYDEFMHGKLAEEIAKSAQEYFKPMLSVRSQHTGSLEQSIRHEIKSSFDGWDVEYFGNFYGLYMDEGNFPPNDVLNAESYGIKAFPVDSRFGSPHFSKTIHGMGHLTPGAPTHYSEKTVDWLAEDEATSLALRYMEDFINEVVLE